MDVIDADAVLSRMMCSELLVMRMLSARFRCAVRSPLLMLLTETASVGDETKRPRALSKLAVIAGAGDTKTAALAEGCLGHERPDMRRAAATAFATVSVGLESSSSAAICLGALLTDSDVRVCLAAAKALPRLVKRGDSAAVQAAMRCLTKAEATIRQAGIMVLAEVASCGNGEVIGVVALTAEKDGDWRVRSAAMRSLPRLARRGDREALCALRVGVNDGHPCVRRVASAALPHLMQNPSSMFAKSRSPPRRSARLSREHSVPVAPRPWRRLGGRSADVALEAGSKRLRTV